MKFNITKEEVIKCMTFAKEAWDKSSQSKKDFGDLKRKENEFIADQTEGKLAEIVFEKFLCYQGIKAELDFEHYDGLLNTDNGDFKIINENNKVIEPKIDIKGSTSLAKWLLVEDYKFINSSTNKFVSKAFIMVGFGKDFPKNKDLRANPNLLLNINVSGELIGWAKTEDFLIDDINNEFWFTWKKGDAPWKPYILPLVKPVNKIALDNFIAKKISDYQKKDLPLTISVPLKARKNFALPTQWLRKDWKELIEILLESNSPSFKIEQIEEINYSLISTNQIKKLLTKPKYSFLIYIKSIDLNENDKKFIANLIYSGIKVILLTDDKHTLDKTMKGKLYDFLECKLLQIHVSNNFRTNNHFIIIDGEDKKSLIEKHSKDFKTFNYEQYKIEHAPAPLNLAIKAGAGTGKTTVMVQRVICLLQRDFVKPSDIALITFTRDSSKEMYSRLRKELFLRYNLTQQNTYLFYIEELKKMNISTIHSFAKKILKDIGSHLGYGKDVQIRNFTLERKKIIEEVLENYFFNNNYRNHNIADVLKPFQLYELVDIINRFWDEMEKKGLQEKDIQSFEWGETSNNAQKKVFNDLFKYIFPAIDKLFQKLKQDNNSVSLNDLTRQVDKILSNTSSTENPLNKLSMNIKYLFIDEFQDSDDVQIRLITQIQQAFKTRIFAVGDVKQSIYRFRGADHTAFIKLKEELLKVNEVIVEKPLQINYRTTQHILNKLHVVFEYWNTQRWLTYNEDDVLFGVREVPKKLTEGSIIFKEICVDKDSSEKEVINMLRTGIKNISLDIESKPSKRKIAALVRTNKEARLLEYWCKRNEIDTYLNIGGTFFISDAVKDFFALIEALLFPNNAISILNYLATPYSKESSHWTEIAQFHGDKNKIFNYWRSKKPIKSLDQGNSLSKKNKNSFSTFLDWTFLIRKEPLLSVLRKIIKETHVEDRYSVLVKHRLESDKNSKKEKIQNQVDLMQKQYILNLNHLMDLLHQEFTSEFVTLNQIYNWIKMNKAVNREEDEPLISNIPDSVVNIITVHRSKGSEYHTVLIPFTDRKFRANYNEILFNKNENKVGWQLNKKIEGGSYKGFTTLNNDFYNYLSKEEDLYVLQEEARLLYVALTRTENQLYIIKNSFDHRGPSDNKTWGKILALPKGEII